MSLTKMITNELQLEWQKIQLEVEDKFLSALQIAADETTENDASAAQFTAILTVAADLTNEMKHTDQCYSKANSTRSNKYPLIIQSCCYSWASLSRFLQLIGGLDGNHLFSLSIQQLLDLIAWSRDYRAASENIHPTLFFHSKKPNLADLPLLFIAFEGGGADTKIAIDIDNQGIFHAFQWVSIMIWEVHRLAQDELLIRTRQEADLWLNKVYSKSQDIHQINNGTLVTNLCEDVFSLATLHIKTLRQQLVDANATNELNIMVVCIVLNRLRNAQIKARIISNQQTKTQKDTLEICCAAANDYYRMSQRVEDLQNDVLSTTKLSKALVGVLQEACDELVNTYVTASIYAVSMASRWVMEPIEGELSQQLFRREWEQILTHNELALTLTTTLADFLSDMEDFLCDEFLVQKFLVALTKAVPIFYLKCLLQISEEHKTRMTSKHSFFHNVPLALKRIKDDIAILKRFFYERRVPALRRICDREFEVLVTILELAQSCHAGSESSLRDFTIILYKQLKDFNLTRFVIGDLWHIIRPTLEKRAMQIVEGLRPRLKKIEIEVENKTANDCMILDLQYRHSLIAMYDNFKRKRPIR